MNEQWKDIPGYEGFYEVSNKGRVRRVSPEKGTWPGRIVTPNRGGDGYQTVRLSRNKVKKTFSTHRIVALVWVPNPHGYKQVNHKDGDKLNPSADNLEWCTARQNMIHARDILNVTFNTGKGVLGSKNGNSKLTGQEVREVKYLLSPDTPVRERAKLFNIHHSRISRIKNNKAWRHT